MESQRTYIAIDLKSFYASVECVERGLDPLVTNLVVADESRTDKTVCLAVSPSLKSYGIGGRARLFEVKQKVPRGVDFIIAPPRMAHYIKYSTDIYKIYLKYIAPEDIHVYSIDEVIMDVTTYLQTYKMTAHKLAMTIIRDVLRQTGITATAGIGTNMYLCKVAMDIVAKHIPADKDGVRIAELDEMSYRQKLWTHQPLTDFWRVGLGTQQRLASYGIYTMGDIARTSLQHEDFLYNLFGMNAELLIDHAWGWEPCTIEEVKSYRPETNSFSSGQVLTEPYSAQKARIIVKEMAEAMALNLLEKHLVTDQIVLTIGYDASNVDDIINTGKHVGPTHLDRYGRSVPKHSHGTANLDNPTFSRNQISHAASNLFDKIVNPELLIRRLNLTVSHVETEKPASYQSNEQPDLFSEYDVERQNQKQEEEKLDKERKLMEATIAIKKRFGKNSLLKGMNFEEGATARNRNSQIGGHKA